MRADPHVTRVAREILGLMDRHRHGELNDAVLTADLAARIADVDRLENLSRTDAGYIDGVRGLATTYLNLVRGRQR